MDHSQLKAHIEETISALPFNTLEPARLYKPMQYILELKGKRIRPILTMLAYHAISKESANEAMQLALAVELFHNFTLMHDDIMDRAPVRRGKPAVHIAWDENVAILSGDALFAYSMGMVVTEFPQQAEALVKEYSRAAMEVCEGQMEDMDFADQEEVEIDAYIEMIRKKTAALLGGCLSLGALAAGAPSELVLQMRAYGEQLGLAFQLQDDLMDAFPPPNFGKQVGGDIIENKKTFLLLTAKKEASGELATNLEYWLTVTDRDEEKVAAVLDIYQQLGIREKTQSLIESYFNSATALSADLAQKMDFAPIQNYLQVIAKRKV